MVLINLTSEIRRVRATDAAVEYLLWIIFAFIVNGNIWIEAWLNNGFYPETIIRNYVTIIFGLILSVFPFLCAQVFGQPPFRLLRERVLAAKQYAHHQPVTYEAGEAPEESEGSAPDSSHDSARKMAALDAVTLLSNNALSSERLSKNIYTRAGVYMMTGAIVAFSGLLFFYFQTAALPGPGDGGIATVIVGIAPKFGILIFIEIVAFFFLRQYRAAMDEFRYFEAIKRRREETLALIKLNEHASPSLTIEQIIGLGIYSSGQPTLEKDQTTELLENRKLEKNELVIIEKLIEALSARKPA